MDKIVDSLGAQQLDRFGIHSLDHFGILVPSLDIARKFFDDFGLDVRKEAKGLGLYTHGCNHRWGIVRKGERKQLQYISFGAYAEHLPRFRQRFAHLGVRELSPPAGVASDGLWCRDTSGTLIEIRVAPKSSPDEKATIDGESAARDLRGCRGRASFASVRPIRLAHILIFSCDVLGDIEFYESILGLRLSDRAGEDIAFLHGPYGSDHHMIAFAKSHKTGLHHTSWTVQSVDEVGVGGMRMEALGYRNGWGFGRHVLGSNYFYYVRDPWDSYAEYSFGIDYVPADVDWPAGNHSAEDAFYVWGPTPPADFNKNHE
jgi:catechol 2,3-dioxygenase-like lactoylglutathione lyase family enzyme